MNIYTLKKYVGIKHKTSEKDWTKNILNGNLFWRDMLNSDHQNRNK